MPEFLNQNPEAELARDEANAWVARFAPLVLDQDSLTVTEIRERLGLVDQLQAEAPLARQRLLMHGTADDTVLRSTLDRAIEQLPSLESDLKKRLGRLAPGDPQSIADLQRVNERLEERMARQEIGVSTDAPQVLELKTAAPNWAGAGFLGLFGLGWTSFTTFHAVFMIGGMAQQFGWWALALLAFYSIFFAVGFGMLAGAVAMASTEEISLNGRELTVRRRFIGWARSKTYTLAPDCEPSIEDTTVGNRDNKSQTSLVLVDVNGNPIKLATSATEWQREQAREKIAAYLVAHP